MYSRLAFAVTAASTLFGAVTAAGTGNLTIVSPGGPNLWWGKPTNIIAQRVALI